MKKPAAPLVSDILRAVHEIAPPHLAESWDNVGLQFGLPANPAGRVMVALEVTKEVLREAAKRKVGTLVTHHPLLFRPLNRMVEDTSVAALSSQLIRQGHAMIAAHTNLDSVAHGTNGELADRLGLQMAGREFLKPAPLDRDKMNYVVFVPTSHVSQVIDAIARAGAGAIGNYSHCTFRAPGTGTFVPEEGADPYDGKIGKLTQADEVRLECVVSKGNVAALIREVRAVHPYETIAFHLYDTNLVEKPTAGMGLVGALKDPTTLDLYIRRVKKALGIASVGVVGDLKKKISRVALCSGGSASPIHNWKPGTADLYVTGEMTHHDCAEAHHRGIATLLVGHFASEAIVSQRFADLIAQELHAQGFKPDVIVTRDERNPLQRV
ncbi:Nif3-like dinuclear metal center hexameric protein [soil metagenome]